MHAIAAVSAYVGLGNAAIERALRELLDDPLHKIRHAAAKALRVACAGCDPPA